MKKKEHGREILSNNFINNFQGGLPDTLMAIGNNLHKTEKKPDFSQIGNYYNKAGVAYYEYRNLIEAAYSFNKALDSFELKDDKGGRSVALNNLGYINFAIGQYDEASKYYNISLQQSNNKLPVTKATIYSNLGIVYLLQKRFESSMYNFKEALLIFRQLDKPSLISATLNNLASVYFEQKKYAEALQYYYESLSFLKTIKDDYTFSSVLNNIGKLYIALKDFEKANFTLNECLKIKIKIGDIQRLGTVYSNLSEVKFYLGDIEAAFRFITESITLQKITNDKYGLSQNYKFLGIILSQSGQNEKAIKYLKNTLDILGELKIEDETENINELISELSSDQT